MFHKLPLKFINRLLNNFIYCYAGDLNETYFVGNVDEESRQLVKCTYECLEKAISIGIYPFDINSKVSVSCLSFRYNSIFETYMDFLFVLCLMCNLNFIIHK